MFNVWHGLCGVDWEAISVAYCYCHERLWVRIVDLVFFFLHTELLLKFPNLSLDLVCRIIKALYFWLPFTLMEVLRIRHPQSVTANATPPFFIRRIVLNARFVTECMNGSLHFIRYVVCELMPFDWISIFIVRRHLQILLARSVAFIIWKGLIFLVKGKVDIYLLSVKLVERATETLRELFFLYLFLVNYFTIGVN